MSWGFDECEERFGGGLLLDRNSDRGGGEHVEQDVDTGRKDTLRVEEERRGGVGVGGEMGCQSLKQLDDVCLVSLPRDLIYGTLSGRDLPLTWRCLEGDWPKCMLEIHGAQHPPPRILDMSLGVRGVARRREKAEKG